MTDRMVRSSADMVAIWRDRIEDLGLTHREVDHLAGWGEGYCSKILSSMKRPGALTIERMCGALAMAFVPIVDTEREAIVKSQWVKRRRT
jgi:hypothetical protein